MYNAWCPRQVKHWYRMILHCTMYNWSHIFCKIKTFLLVISRAPLLSAIIWISGYGAWCT